MKKLLLILFFLSITYGETVVSGVISQNAWWTKEKSPYIITNDVVIGPLARLVIDPGVEILVEKPLQLPKGIDQMSRSDTFSVSIRILGSLRCNGKPDNPIIIHGRYIKSGDEYTHWEGIFINSNRTSEISMSYTHINNAVTGVTISKGTPLIRNSLFEKNHIGLKVQTSASPRIVNALFTNNFFAGIRIEKANPEIYNTIFYKNRNFGIYSDHVSQVSVLNCGFWGNGDRATFGCSSEIGALQKINKNGDSTDVYGNIRIDPAFVGSDAEAKIIQTKIKKLNESSLKKPSVDAINAIKSPANITKNRIYFLSKHSPYVNAGNSNSRFKELDGSLPDLGIWGGPESLQF